MLSHAFSRNQDGFCFATRNCEREPARHLLGTWQNCRFHAEAGALLLSLGGLNFTGEVRMKIVARIVRLLLGLMFLVSGLNLFLQFLKGPTPGGLAGEFLQALFQSHYALAIGAVQAVGGALLLINRYVPLALTILGPVIVNILLFHLSLNHEGIAGALIAALFWFVLFVRYRQCFSGVFTAKASSAS